MKRIIALAFAAMLLLSAGTAVAANGFYIGGKMALTNVMVDDIDWGYGYSSDGDFFSFGIGPVFGYDMGAQGGLTMRIEGEVLFRTGEDWKKTVGNTSGKVEIDCLTTILGNVWYDITAIPAGNITVKPFVGASAGLGIAKYEIKSSSPTHYYSKDGNETAFLIGPGGGVRFDINDKLAADALVRYLFSTKYDFDGEKYKAPMLDFNFGLAYKF